MAAHKSNTVSVDGVASVRFGLAMVAKQMQMETMERELFADKKDIIKATKLLCTESAINRCDTSGITGPCLYLLKILLRQYGHSCLVKVADIYPWVIPQALQHHKV